MLKEEFAIYQDQKNNKTTIVIRNMSQKTFSKITELLLGDIKTAETISGLEEVVPKEKILTDKTDGMEQITSIPVGSAPSVADTENTALYYPEPENVEEDPEAVAAREEAEAQAVQGLWTTYDESNPAELLRKFIGLYESTGSSSAVKTEAGKQAGELIVSLTNNRRTFCATVWDCRNFNEIASVMLKTIAQKGCGDGLTTGTQEYTGAITNVLCMLSDEEIYICADAIAKKFV